MIPVWVYFIAAGIVFCAIMAIKTGRDERREENEMIEREGEVYMQRLEEKKEEKKAGERSFG
ncbi:sporulation YhaL family protein [Cytobacillus gottheilii]|uniref:Sporulation YhaL family protein n=1 Tax=Cytobacillus gottheilii TaxID=859144 RepID=A0ABX8FFL2_9BACI|nr:sporulation YhaL family protein [Cytobacillus gottheilii]QVY62784.1 sporulation YhaL family protein [Cytobacillus gottheilii]